VYDNGVKDGVSIAVLGIRVGTMLYEIVVDLRVIKHCSKGQWIFTIIPKC